MIKRMIPAFVGIVLLGLFVLPLFTRRLLNIGNATGILLGGILLLYGIFMPKVHAKIRGFWQKTAGKVVLSIITVCIAAVMTLAVVETVYLVKAVRKKPADNATVVVLGCKVYGEKASLTLRERLNAAYDYLLENEEAACVVSGGQGPDEDISEALCMYRYLEDKGIDASRLYMEDTSTSTQENLENSLQVIRENGLNTECRCSAAWRRRSSAR